MSGTDATYHLTKEDIKSSQSNTSKVHGGDVPKGSEAAMMQSIVDKAEKDKPQIIAERQANLPLPDAPPGPGDFNSADQRTVNVGSGDVATGNLSSGDDALRGPATGGSEARIDGDELKTNAHGLKNVGREGQDNLSGLPSDAVTRDKKDAVGLADTTNQ